MVAIVCQRLIVDTVLSTVLLCNVFDIQIGHNKTQIGDAILLDLNAYFYSYVSPKIISFRENLFKR